MADRFDSLLDEALATGRVPSGVTDGERAEIEAALRAAGVLRASAAPSRDEATASLPTARARFERFMAAEAQQARPAPATVPKAPPRPGPLGRFLGRQRVVAFGALAAVLVVVAAAALFAPRLGGGGGVETASAQVLSPGDYAQLEGVVEEVTGEGDAYEMVLRTYHASLRIQVSAATAGLDSGIARPRAGDALIIGGVVQDDLSVAASTLVAGIEPPADLPATDTEPDRLRAAQVGDGLRGKVLTFALTRDGVTARVLLQLRDGRRVLVWVDEASAESLLLRSSAIGAQVTVTRGATRDIFSLQLSEPSDPGTGQRDAPLRFTGVITGRTANVLTVATNRGEVRVTVVSGTIVLPGESGLDRRAIREGATLIGHTIAVAGSLGPRGQTIVAEVVVLGATAGP